MYQALYRKWRPRTFSGVAGQEHVTETLRSQIISGRLSHAYLFVGTRGTGKTSCAKILARAVNCQSPENGNPCNKCTACTGIENGSILDVLELDAASNNGVDNVRALREEAVYTPASVSKRVYIIDEVHMLSNAAFNALLKILEEPPEHLLFILATTELHKVPATILSRCQRFTFRRLSAETITAQLMKIAKNESLELSPDAAGKLAALADGSMRDALSLLDQCAADTVIDLQRVLDTIGLAGNGELLRLAAAVAVSDAAAALEIFDELYSGGKDVSALLGELAVLLRDVLMFKMSKNSPLLSGGFDGASLAQLADKLPPERLFYCLEAVRESVYSLSHGSGARLAAEMCFIRLCDERLSEGAAALTSRIERLEEQLRCGAVITPERKPAPVAKQAAAEDKPPVSAPVSPDMSAQPRKDAENPAVGETVTPEPDVSEPVAAKPDVPESAAPEPDAQPRENGFWQEILELLRSDIPVYTLLSDSAQVSAELSGGTLIVRAGNPFAVNTIESKTVMEPLRAAAGKALGREVLIRVETGVNNAGNGRDRLESLSAFDIIKFE